jgi:hypothetical protein
MTPEEWNQAINETLSKITSIPRSSNFDLEGRSNWGLEKSQNRYTVKIPLINVLQKIFPWFHAKNDPKQDRFRQTLKRDRRKGVTIEKVYKAINYFLNARFSDDDLQFLRNYYSEMEIPSFTQCLTSIVDVYYEFRREREKQRLLNDEALLPLIDLLKEETNKSHKRPRQGNFHSFLAISSFHFPRERDSKRNWLVPSGIA